MRDSTERRVAWYFRGFVALFLITALAGTYQLNVNSDRAAESKRLAQEFQIERVNSVRSNCEMTNARHKDTIDAIDAAARQATALATPTERKRLEQGRARTLLIIQALVPLRNCDEVVAKAVPSSVR